MKKELLDIITNIESNLNLMKEKLAVFVESVIPEKQKIVEETKVVEVPEPTKVPEATKVPDEKKPVISDALRQLVENPTWGKAVEQDLICNENSHEDKMDRAKGIRDIFCTNFNFENKKILDFGTGYGHLVQAISEKNPTIAVGYDVKNEFQIASTEKTLFSTSWDEVVKNGPYDFIIIYDVIDHVVNETPQQILMKAKSVLNNNGTIRMRCHPFISRHGGHVYTKINKAYAHLILTESELKELGHNFNNYPTVKVTTPLRTYAKFISDAGLKMVDHKLINEPAHNFFLTGTMADRIKMNLKIKQLLIPQMGMQFVDYTLAK